MAVTDKLLPKRFEILRELGSGGTSVVYHARDKDSDRDVAVKVLIKERLGDRFLREAARLKELSHPNLVTFFEVGRHEGRDFLVMEYLPGGDLSHHLRGKGSEELLRLFIQICAGLGYLHSQGVVHRDIKPANILLDARGRPKLTDLGSAREVDRQTRITKAGSILGTYAYLAPEQIQSLDAGPAADLYSLGVCLFEALTGRRPFVVKNEFKLMKAHLEEPPPSLHKFRPELPASLENLVASLLEKQPEARPTTAKVVGRLLERCLMDLESQEKRQLVESDPEIAIERLTEDQRSLLLAVGYLGEQASFTEICAASAFAEDRTDTILEQLLEAKLLTCPEQDAFVLTFPRKLLLSRITPRVSELLQKRLAASGLVGEPSGMTTATLSTQSESTVVPAEVTIPELPRRAPRSHRRFRLLAALLITACAGGAAWMWSQSSELVVTSTPERAAVFLDGSWKGSTPVRLSRLAPGAYTLEIAQEGYLRQVEEIALLSGRTAQSHFTLKESRGRLFIENLPEDAYLTVDGAVYDPKNLKELSLLPGKTRVKVTRQGYRSFQQDVVVRAGEPTSLRVEMSPVEGRLEITSEPSGAVISFDGKPIGTTPKTLETLTFGLHALELSLPGYTLYQETVVVSDEAPLSLHRELTPVPTPPLELPHASPTPAVSTVATPTPAALPTATPTSTAP